MDGGCFESSDLSLLFLFRSHTEICQSLGPLVEWRMRQVFPRDWKDRMSLCVSRKTREKVRKRLNDGEKIEDIFVLCKVIRRYMHTVFYVDERHDFGVNRLVMREDFRSTEYLHRTVEAMETIRHRAFHGEGVFPDEVMASISHGSQTMSLLTRTTQNERVDCTLGALQLLKQELSDFQNGRLRQVSVTVAEGTDVFLHGCLTQLEKDLHKLLQDTFSAEMTFQSHRLGDLSQLLDFLKNHVQSRQLRVQHSPRVPSKELHSACKIVKDIRNMQAHERLSGASLSVLREKVQKARILWQAFDFNIKSVDQVLCCASSGCSNETKLTQKRVVRWFSVPVVLTLSSHGHEYFENLSMRRATRSKGKVFVGREKELRDCTALFSRAHQQVKDDRSTVSGRGKLLVIEGASGVGKTSLASELLDMTREQYPRQMWLCSSTPEILTAEIKTHLLLKCLHEDQATGEIQNLSKAERMIRLLPEELIVLDDVTFETLDMVEKFFARTSHSIIITTCCGHAHRFVNFSESFSEVLHVCLSVLDTESSMQLINLRGIPLDGFEITLKRIVELDLENLPLATNIFVSLLQERLWCEKAKKKIGAKEVNTNEGCEMETILTGFQSNLNKEIVKFSLRSTESPHIRGIAGLVNIAIKRLVQEPSALCLVLLVAIAGPKGLNISIMKSSWSAARLYSKLHIDPEDVDGMRLVSAVECLLGPEGSVREFALELALSTGLVTRQSSIPCLQMHQLLSSYIQDYVLNDCGPLAGWVAVTPTTVKYMISVLAFEHYFMTSVPVFLLGFPIVERDMLRKKIVNETISWSVCIHLGRALFTCQDKKLPRYLMWLLRFLLSISRLPELYQKEATKENLDFPSIMTAIGNSQEVYGGRFNNYLLWVLVKHFKAKTSDQQTRRKLQTVLEPANFMFAHPSSKPPHNLFDFFGTPNLTWQSFVITNVDQCDTGKVVKTEVCQLATAVQLFCKNVLHHSSLQPSAVLSGPSHQKWASHLTRPFDNGQQANRKRVTWCINNFISRVEDLFKLQRYPELVRLLLSKETRLIIGHNDFESSSCEGSSQMDILLAGSIVFSCLGLQKKAKEWCGELLRRIQKSGNRGGTYARYQSIANAVIGYNLLLENNISQSLKFFSLSVCSIGSEIQSAWVLADEGIEKFFSLLCAYAEILQVQSLLSLFSCRKMN